jgi:hypothetical protein
MFVLAYAFLVTYQAYYLLDHLGSAEADVPQQVFLGTLVQSAGLVRHRCSAADCRTGPATEGLRRHRVRHLRRGPVLIAAASSFNGFLVGMAIGGLGFGLYMAVDLALVVDVLPDSEQRGEGPRRPEHRRRLPSAIAPAIAPVILAVGGGSYGVLYAVAGVCALAAGAAIVPVRQVR